jgi:hypothetical protein
MTMMTMSNQARPEALPAVRTLLENCSLVVYQTRSISPDRDTGNTVKKGARTVRETVTTFDASALRAINAEKQRGARLCQQYGTKLESLAAWVVANDRVEELLTGLNAIKGKVTQLAEDLARNIGGLVESYAVLNSEHADQIRALGPTPDDVCDSTRILFTAYRVQPDDVVADAGGLSEDVHLLHMQALHEFHMALKDAKVNPEGQYFTQQIREVLGRIADKAQSLAFLHPVLGDVGKTVRECLQDLPTAGGIDGFSAVALGSLISQLMDPRALLSNGGFKKVEVVANDPAPSSISVGNPLDPAALYAW